MKSKKSSTFARCNIINTMKRQLLLVVLAATALLSACRRSTEQPIQTFRSQTQQSQTSQQSQNSQQSLSDADLLKQRVGRGGAHLARADDHDLVSLFQHGNTSIGGCLGEKAAVALRLQYTLKTGRKTTLRAAPRPT